MRGWIVRYGYSFSLTGLIFATLGFAASLTPTLIPRGYLLQGVLSGLAAATGYGAGFFLHWLWRYLGLPTGRDSVLNAFKFAAATASAVISTLFLWRAAGWQNSIRTVMGLAPVDSVHPLEVGAIALATFVVLIAVGRAFLLVLAFLSRRLRQFVPPRLAFVTGIGLTVLIFWSIGEGVLLRYGMRFADSSFQALDRLMAEDETPPADPLKTGSPASRLRWAELGRMGRSYIASGPGAAEIARFTGRPAMQPLRVYAGLGSADTPEARAALALEELKRVGGFERKILVVITPTGTGWVDEEGIDPLEFLHDGNIASVAVQYSYLASWASLLTQPGYGAEQARALFAAVYGHWRTLPKETRPKLYLYGLSLGALSSELSNELFEVLGDPYQGALWAGPPFASRIWGSITRNRDPQSPAWLPRFRDGSYVRFTAQKNALDIPGAIWGPMRIVYLQYASDPIVFFEPRALYREPDWMRAPRGPDVSPELRWYPLVTVLQLLFDVVIGTASPIGHGHVYAAEHYIDAWVAVTDVQGWPDGEIARLKQHFIARRK